MLVYYVLRGRGTAYAAESARDVHISYVGFSRFAPSRLIKWEGIN